MGRRHRGSPSLFDDRDMAEISSPDYPGERFVVCKNPLPAEERARKRAELLAATEKELARIQARVRPADIQVSEAGAVIAVAGGDHRPCLSDALRDLGKEVYQPLRRPVRGECDDLKYIPLSPDDPKSYVSLGLDLRERFESVNAASFGVRGIPVQDINCQTRDLTVNARSASAPPTAVEKMVDGLAFCQLSLIS
jgi:hypothetical protein